MSLGSCSGRAIALADATNRLDHVIKDCEPAAIFTGTGFFKQIKALLPDAYRGTVATTDANFDCARIIRSPVKAEGDVAVLQYTSGSTGAFNATQIISPAI